jgi:Ca2+-binding RTX toxin-like protein
MPQYTATIALSALNGTNGFVLPGLNSGDRTGNSVSSAGDVNGDGFDDFLVGASSSSTVAGTAGVAYVVFGKDTAFDAAFDFTTLDGTNGFRIDPVAAGDEAGTSVASAGDVNGDGFADIIVGAALADPNSNTSAGTAYVIYGQTAFLSGTFALSSLDATNGVTIIGLDAGDKAGTSVGGSGDFNGDGLDDFLIGAPGANTAPGAPSGDGESYIIFGNSTSGLPSIVNPSMLTGTGGLLPGVILGGATTSAAGSSISFIGDINGDGRDDVIVGGPNADVPGSGGAGSSYVVFGSNTFSGATILPGDLNGSNGFRIDGTSILEHAGTSVASAGDVNGDGINDLIIGAPITGATPGKAYVVFGQATGYAPVLNLATLTAGQGFAINGLQNFDLMGESVASAGDVNGDGFDDVIIGARDATVGALASAGESYVIFGKGSSFGTSFDLATLDGTNGFRIQGAADGDRSGKSVASAGDINGDGLDDLVVGAFRAGAGGTSKGAAYVILGQLSDVAVNLTGTVAGQSLVGSNLDDTMNGLGGDDELWGHNGNDTLNGGTGNDTLRGGAGNDTYFIDSLGDVLIETSGIDTVNSTVSKTLDAGFENLTLLGTLNIQATGNVSNNTLTGNSAGNVLNGGAGADTLIGGRGRDIMTGGLSTDVLVRDVFDFNFASETGKRASTRDVIKDFRHLIDDIDLRTIDANSKVAGNQSFSFLATKGAAFTGVAGQLHWLQLNPAGTAADKTIIEGDINGDRITDFQIELTGLKSLTKADFLL